MTYRGVSINLEILAGACMYEAHAGLSFPKASSTAALHDYGRLNCFPESALKDKGT